MLRLVPIAKSNTNHVITSHSSSDDWLNNDDAQLLAQLALNEQGPQHTVKQLHTQGELRTFELEQLDLTPGENNYKISLKDGQKVALHDKDILQLPWVTLQVLLLTPVSSIIEPQASTNNQMIASSYQDIWGDPLPTSEPHKKIIDPFQDAAPLLPVEHTTQRNRYFTPVNSTLPAINSTTPVNPISQNQHSSNDVLNALSVDSHMSYQQTMASQVDRKPQLLQQLFVRQHMPTQVGGNVLHDLGINEQATVLPDSVSDGKSCTFMEQSPLDLINDCWGEVVAGSSNARPVAFIALPTVKPAVMGLKQNLKRLVLKILD